VFISPTAFYSPTEVRDLINTYITSKSLVNAHNQAYINLDQALVICLSAKSAGKSKDKGTESEPSGMEFVKREELTKKILEKMQPWHEIRPGQGDIVRR
jgi:translation initiation factor 2D